MIGKLFCKFGIHSFTDFAETISRTPPYYGKWVKHRYCKVCGLKQQIRTNP